MPHTPLGDLMQSRGWAPHEALNQRPPAARLPWLDVEPATQLGRARTELESVIMFVSLDAGAQLPQPAEHPEIVQN